MILGKSSLSSTNLDSNSLLNVVISINIWFHFSLIARYCYYTWKEKQVFCDRSNTSLKSNFGDSQSNNQTSNEDSPEKKSNKYKLNVERNKNTNKIKSNGNHVSFHQTQWWNWWESFTREFLTARAIWQTVNSEWATSAYEMLL